MRRLTALCGCMVTTAFAEVFQFKQTPLPASLSLTSYYVFHVYAAEKKPKVSFPYVGPAASQTTQVTFKNFDVQWSNGKVGVGDYGTLQVSLIPWSRFWNLYDQTHFCTGSSMESESKVIFRGNTTGVPIFNVGSSQEATFPITSTGEYLLTVTNCGGFNGTMTKGEVIVNQLHGYLPGNKIGTLQWWGWFSIINALICLFWVIALARHYTSLLYIHKMLAALAVTALLEAVVAYVQHKDWNNTGTQSMVLLVATMFFYCIKYLLTLRMVVNTAAGSAVTTGKIELDEFQFDINCVVFFFFQWTWKVLLSRKENLMINPMFSMACTIPSSILWLLLFAWVYRKFQAMLSALKDRMPASEAVTMLTNTRSVLLASVLLATLVLLLQFADIMLAQIQLVSYDAVPVLSRTPWNLQWVPYDAAPHSVYTLFLLALMIVWLPRGDTWKFGYLDQVNLDENVGGGTGKFDPEQIGLAEEENGS